MITSCQVIRTIYQMPNGLIEPFFTLFSFGTYNK